MESAQNLMDISKMQRKIQKKFLATEIIASEIASVNSLYYEGNTCHGQSMPIETDLRLCI